MWLLVPLPVVVVVVIAVVVVVVVVVVVSSIATAPLPVPPHNNTTTTSSTSGRAPINSTSRRKNQHPPLANTHFRPSCRVLQHRIDQVPTIKLHRELMTLMNIIFSDWPKSSVSPWAYLHCWPRVHFPLA